MNQIAMKKLLLPIAFFWSVFIVNSQEYIELTEPFPSTAAPKFISPLPDSQRLKSSTYGNFNVELEGFTPTQAMVFEEALNLWEEKLFVSTPIKIKAQMGGVTGSNAFTILVGNHPIDPLNSLSSEFFPAALMRQWNPEFAGKSSPDFTIKFNGDLEKWDFRSDADPLLPEGKNDFKTAALRAIAKGLGFTSLLSGNNTVMNKSKTYPATQCTNNHTRNSAGVILSTLPNKSPELLSFVRSNDVFWDRRDYNNYKLYTPSSFDRTVTLEYFDPEGDYDEEKALLYPECSGRIYHIGSKITDVLQDIGWSLSRLDLKIETTDIDESGIIPYDKNRIFNFSASSILDISSYSWSFEIKKSGMYASYSSGSASTFSFSLPSSIDETFDRTASGQLIGRVKLQAVSTSGIKEEAFFNVYVNYTPPQPTVKILELIPVDPYTYKMVLEFGAKGASSYAIRIENEYSPIVLSYSSNQPGYNQFTIPNIDIDDYLTIIIKAKNEYGYSQEAYTYYPVQDESMGNISLQVRAGENHLFFDFQTPDHISVNTPIVSGVIIDLNGRVIRSFADNTEVDTGALSKGVYIIRVKDKFGKIYSAKYIKQ